MNTIEKTHPGTSLKSLPVLFAALCMLLCLSACRPKPYPSLLLAADSLASVLPDSACALLASYAADTADEPLYVRMYYRLLCIKAKDKAYIVHTSDSAILPVVAYYEHHRRLPHLPEAYYYAGRVYSDLGDAPQALAYFQRALDVMREDKDRVDMTVKKLVLSQMGTLFKRQNLYPEALEVYRQSFQCKILLQDSVGMIYSNRDIGHTFVLLEQRDSALYYYQRAYQLSLLLGKKALGNGIQSLIARLYTEEGNYEAARRSLQIALQDVPKSERSGTYYTAARFYHFINEKDSAECYYNKLLLYGSLDVKEMANRGLASIALSQGKTVPAAQYLYQALLLGDSIRKLTKTDEVRSAHSHYNYQLREQENQRLKLQNLRQRQMNVAILVVFVLFACGGTLYYLHRRKVMRLRLQVAEQLQAEAYRNSRQFVEDNREHIHRLENRIQELNTQLQGSSLQCEQLQQQIDILSHMNRQVELEQNKRLLDQDLFSQSEIYALFRQKLTTGQAVTSAEWSRFAEQLDGSFDGFTQKLGRLGQLKEKNGVPACSLRLGLKTKRLPLCCFFRPKASVHFGGGFVPSFSKTVRKLKSGISLFSHYKPLAYSVHSFLHSFSSCSTPNAQFLHSRFVAYSLLFTEFWGINLNIKHMKHFFILLIGLLCCLNGWADEVNIALEKIKDSCEGEQGDERSLSNEPVATHDGPQVYIYSEKTLENVCIRVTDANGNAVASEDVDEIQGRYTFYIEDTEVKGTLTLFIQTATESYEGIFSLE